MTDRWAQCVSVIIPVYNEEAHLAELLRAVYSVPVKKEVIIVDDGSTDSTRQKLRALSDPDTTVIFHEKNCGKGASIRTALAYARGEYVLIQDSDLEYDPQDYPALLRPLIEGRANVVYGVRPDRPERGLRFFLGAKFLTHLTNLLYGAGIHDEATCYKVFRRSVLSRLKMDCLRFEFCPEVTAKLCRMGRRYSFNLGRSRMTVESTWTSRKPCCLARSCAWLRNCRLPAPFQRGSVSGKCMPMSPRETAPSSASVMA